MLPPTSDEKDFDIEEHIKRAQREANRINEMEKDRNFPHSAQSRPIFRGIRTACKKLGIDFPVPGNDVRFTDEYCRKYQPEWLKNLGWWVVP
jgi:hypothetical protein